MWESTNVEILLQLNDQLPLVFSHLITIVLLQAVDGSARNKRDELNSILELFSSFDAGVSAD